MARVLKMEDGSIRAAASRESRFNSKKGGSWETIGELSSYPATTATDRGGIAFGQPFELVLDRPVKAVAVRVIGVPSCGNDPKQAFSSCGELQAFAD